MVQSISPSLREYALKRCAMASQFHHSLKSPSVLVRLDHVARFIVSANHRAMGADSALVGRRVPWLRGVWISSFAARVAGVGPRSATAAVAYGIWPRCSRSVLCDSNSMSASTMMRTSSWKRIFGSQFRIFFALEGSPIRRSTSAGRS